MSEQGTAERIATAALAIITEEGARAVSMRRVAEAAGITPMAIYRHYANREALLRAIADTCFRQLGEEWGKRSEVTDFDTRVTVLLNNFLDVALGKPHLYSFLMTERWEQARRFPDDFSDRGSPAFNTLVETVELGMRQGMLRTDDPLEVTLTITASAQGLVQLYLAGRIGLSEPEFRSLCARSTTRILNGLKA